VGLVSLTVNSAVDLFVDCQTDEMTRSWNTKPAYLPGCTSLPAA